MSQTIKAVRRRHFVGGRGGEGGHLGGCGRWRLLALCLAAAMVLVACNGDVAVDDPDADPDDTDVADDVDVDDVDVDDVDVDDVEAMTASFATFYPPENWQMGPVTDYHELITEASGGSISFDYHWAGSLLGTDELSAGLRDGIADLAVYVPGWNPDDYPVDVWIAFLGFLNESKPLVGMLQGIGATLEWSFENEDMQAEFADNGVVPLAARYQILDDYSLFCREPVTSLADAQGTRARIGGAAWAEEASNVGMEPVEMPGPEIFEAFERGIIDCMMGSPPDFVSLGLTEVGQHHTQSIFTGFTTYGMIAGEGFWDDLSNPAQQVMWDNLPYYLEGIVQSYLRQYYRFFTEIAEDQGLEFHNIDAEMEARIQEYHEEIIDTIADDAPPQVSDPQGSVDRYIELHEKWLGIVQDLGYDHDYDTWPEWVEDNEPEDVDLTAWREAIWEEIYEPRRP